MKQKVADSRSYHFSETSFKFLMQKRIYRILIICSNYDFYMLEDDGRIDEQLFTEYVSLNLRYPPSFIHANNEETAFTVLKENDVKILKTPLN